MKYKRSIPEYLAAARLALEDLSIRSYRFRGWQCLHEQNDDGQKKGVLPYTEEAITLFEKAYQYNPEDPYLLHHLAIAHHARAWDLELAGDKHAADAWKTALEYWRKVAASGPFFTELLKIFAQLDSDKDETFLTEQRRNLQEDLLDIHVDFIRHYCEGEVPDRAIAHIELIRKASIPPAVKNRLVDKVYHAMTGSVPAARALSAFDSALVTIERFLTLFPDHLPALRVYVEIAGDWTTTLSYQEHWEQIMALDSRTASIAERLAQHNQIQSDPLAGPALEALALKMGICHSDRGEMKSCIFDPKPISDADRNEAHQAFERAVWWSQLGLPFSPQESQLSKQTALIFNNFAIALLQEAIDVNKAAVDIRTRLRASHKLYSRSFELISRSIQLNPEEHLFTENLQVVKSNMDHVERQLLTYRIDQFNDMEAL